MKIDISLVQQIRKVGKIRIDVTYICDAKINSIIYNSEKSRDEGFEQLENEFAKYVPKFS